MDLIFYNLATVLVLLLSIILWVRSRRPIGYPPGPTPIPVIGNMHNIAKGHVLKTFRELRTKYGDIFSLSLGQFWVIVVNGTENLRELLVKNGEYTSDRPPFYIMELLANKGNIFFRFINTATCVIYTIWCLRSMSVLPVDHNYFL